MNELGHNIAQTWQTAFGKDLGGMEHDHTKRQGGDYGIIPF